MKDSRAEDGLKIVQHCWERLHAAVTSLTREGVHSNTAITCLVGFTEDMLAYTLEQRGEAEAKTLRENGMALARDLIQMRQDAERKAGVAGRIIPKRKLATGRRR